MTPCPAEGLGRAGVRPAVWACALVRGGRRLAGAGTRRHVGRERRPRDLPAALRADLHAQDVRARVLHRQRQRRHIGPQLRQRGGRLRQRRRLRPAACRPRRRPGLRPAPSVPRAALLYGGSRVRLRNSWSAAYQGRTPGYAQFVQLDGGRQALATPSQRLTTPRGRRGAGRASAGARTGSRQVTSQVVRAGALVREDADRQVQRRGANVGRRRHEAAPFLLALARGDAIVAWRRTHPRSLP